MGRGLWDSGPWTWAYGALAHGPRPWECDGTTAYGTRAHGPRPRAGDHGTRAHGAGPWAGAMGPEPMGHAHGPGPWDRALHGTGTQGGMAHGPEPWDLGPRVRAMAHGTWVHGIGACGSRAHLK